MQPVRTPPHEPVMRVRQLPRASVAACLIAVATAPVTAQQAPASTQDSLRLSALHHEAVAKDPRQRQFGLLAKQTELRLHNLSAERLPSFTAEGQAQYQSDVFTAPSQQGGGTIFPSPSKDTYDGHLAVEQPIVDPTIGVRQQVERAQLAQSEAEVRTALFDLRREVNDAFFGAALLAERRRIIAVTIADLEKQLEEARVRVREGAALPSDTAAIRSALGR